MFLKSRTKKSSLLALTDLAFKKEEEFEEEEREEKKK